MSRRTLLIIAVLGCQLGVCRGVGAATPSVMPREGVLVLRSGQVMHGQITQAGDRYIVTWGDGGEVRVPTSDVEMCCRDLDEAYARRRVLAERGGLGRRLDLAEWCLREGLRAQAADELLAAMAIEPNHPRVRQLERRLQLAATPAPPPVKARPQPETDVGLSDIEKRLRELPEVAVERFTVHLQPLLLNRCGANACHGATSEAQFRLIRPSWGKTATRRYTQRNLYAVLQQLDPQTPEKSRLLTVPSAPHGPLQHPVFGEGDQAHLKLLTEWATKIAKHQAPDPVPETIVTAPSQLLQASYSPSAAPPGGQAEARAQAAPSPDAARRPADDAFVPRDPFDPEIFNRRYFPADRVLPRAAGNDSLNGKPEAPATRTPPAGR
jgi:hypothetical protein